MSLPISPVRPALPTPQRTELESPSFDQEININAKPEVTQNNVPKPVTIPKWETETKERIRSFVRKSSRHLQELIARDANEGDTRLFITDFLCEALGYDKYDDLTTEFVVKGEFADYGIKSNGEVLFFLEAKRCSLKLGERHLKQVQTYAVNKGVEWMLLTNGRIWQVWHLTGGLPVITTQVFELDLLADNINEQINLSFLLSKEASTRNKLLDYWKRKDALAPSVLKDLILGENVIGSIRRDLKRTTGHSFSSEDIRSVIEKELLR